MKYIFNTLAKRPVAILSTLGSAAVIFLIMIGAASNSFVDLAVQNNADWALEPLVMMGADIHRDQELALRTAATLGQLDVASKLISLGANPHANFDEALVNAARNGHAEVVSLLLDRGANPTSISTKHCTTLPTSAMRLWLKYFSKTASIVSSR